MKELIELFAEELGRYPQGNVQDELRSWAADEITTLRQQLAAAKEENERVRQANIHTMDVFEDMKAAKEKAEARVAELTHSRQIEKTSMLMRVSRLSETLEAIRSGEFSLPKCQQLADRALGSPVTEAAILRLQAEAVKESAQEMLEEWPEFDVAHQWLIVRSESLTQQAAEAERAGGEK